MAQLAEWSFPIPEVCSSNPIMGKKIAEYVLQWKRDKKEAGSDLFFVKRAQVVKVAR